MLFVFAKDLQNCEFSYFSCSCFVCVCRLHGTLQVYELMSKATWGEYGEFGHCPRCNSEVVWGIEDEHWCYVPWLKEFSVFLDKEDPSNWRCWSCNNLTNEEVKRMANFSQNPVVSQAYRVAVADMLTWHSNQVRKDGTPYFAHLLSVSALCVEAGLPEYVAIAALFHDILEDTEVKPEDIEENYGVDVLKLVKAVSHNKSIDPMFQKDDFIQRLSTASSYAVMINAADTLHNLRGYVRMDYELLKENFTSSKLGYYWTLVHIYRGEYPICTGENKSVIPQWMLSEIIKLLYVLEKVLRTGEPVSFNTEEEFQALTEKSQKVKKRRNSVGNSFQFVKEFQRLLDDKTRPQLSSKPSPELPKVLFTRNYPVSGELIIPAGTLGDVIKEEAVQFGSSVALVCVYSDYLLHTIGQDFLTVYVDHEYLEFQAT